MKILSNTLLLILLCVLGANAQRLSRVNGGVEIGTGYQDATWAPSITYYQDLSLNHFDWIRIGWGLRGSGLFSDQTALFPHSNTTLGDSLQVRKINSISASFFGSLTVSFGRFDLGANTDLINLAFGSLKTSTYTKDITFKTEDDLTYKSNKIRSAPSLLNFLPAALDNQNGNSEIFARYRFTNTIGIKAGYLASRVTYSTEQKLDDGKRRFSKMFGMPFIAITFPISY